MSTMSRRSTLAMLGLTPASAVGAETMLHPEATGSAHTGIDTSPQQIASALRRLAEQIDGGAVKTVRIDFSASLAAREILQNELKLTFLYDGSV